MDLLGPLISGGPWSVRFKKPLGHTLANILKDSKTRNVIIIDARYPYEYEGGHISTGKSHVSPDI